MTRLPSILLICALCACSQAPEGPLKVFKYDGSVQCEGPGKSVEEMERELTDAGVEVLCGQKAGDGYAYPAVCGAATGSINVYTIPDADLAKAESAGFKSTRTLPDYQDQACNP